MIFDEILRKNKGSIRKRDKVLFLILILGCLTTPLFSETVHEFQFPTLVKTLPELYGSKFYALNEKGGLMKLSDKGYHEWGLSQTEEWTSYQLQFDRVFLINQKNQLSCYDAEYGYRLWGPMNYHVKEMVLRYPMGLFIDHKGAAFAFDFFSGQIRWSNHQQNWDRVFDVLDEQGVYFRSGQHLFRLDLMTGKIETDTPLSFKVQDIQKSEASVFLMSQDAVTYQLDDDYGGATLIKKDQDYVLKGAVQDYLVLESLIDVQLLLKNLHSSESKLVFEGRKHDELSVVGPDSEMISFIDDKTISFYPLVEEASPIAEIPIPDQARQFLGSFLLNDFIYVFFSDRMLIWKIN